MTAILQDVQPGSNYLKQLAVHVDSTLNLSGATAEWQLRDDNQRVLSTGDATYTVAAAVDGEKKITLEGTIAIPANLGANPQGFAYTLVWIITPSSGPKVRAQETVVVASNEYQVLGAQDTILMNGTTRARLILPQSYTTVTLQVFKGNERITGFNEPVAASYDGVSFDGHSYGVDLSEANLDEPSLDHYTMIWTYNHVSQTPQQTIGHAYRLNASILGAMKDMQTMVQRASLTAINTPDSFFQPSTMIEFLRLGRDTFNGTSHPTMFTMTKAIGPIRMYWIQYSAAALLRSQALVEALRNFDFGGSTVSLTVEHAEAFRQAAEAIEQQLEAHVAQLKAMLSKRGQTSGDGSQSPLAMKAGSAGSIGIGLSPVSNTRWMGGNGRFFNR